MRLTLERPFHFIIKLPVRMGECLAFVKAEPLIIANEVLDRIFKPLVESKRPGYPALKTKAIRF